MDAINNSAPNHSSRPSHTDLQVAYDLWLGPAGLNPASQPSEGEPVNLARIRDMVDDDPGALREVVDLYLSESARLMDELRNAVLTGSAYEAEAIAHKLGGSSAVCGMVAIVPSLYELERSGKAGRFPENEQLVREADHQMSRIRTYLASHVTQA